MRVDPEPSPEEGAAIIVAFEVLLKEREESEDEPSLKRSRWRLAGLLGHAPPPGMKLEGSLWSYSSWEGMV